MLFRSEYDFSSELNVNILGHIFEQSISDIEELKADIKKEKNEKVRGKRKKDGIYYTPEYITRYMIKEGIAKWLLDKRSELGEDKLPKIPIIKEKMNKNDKNLYTRAKSKNIEFWEEYRKVLISIKVLDPACGSGAFLNQAFDFLYAEGQRVNRLLSELTLLEEIGRASCRERVYI